MITTAPQFRYSPEQCDDNMMRWENGRFTLLRNGGPFCAAAVRGPRRRIRRSAKRCSTRPPRSAPRRSGAPRPRQQPKTQAGGRTESPPRQEPLKGWIVIGQRRQDRDLPGRSRECGGAGPGAKSLHHGASHRPHARSVLESGHADDGPGQRRDLGRRGDRARWLVVAAGLLGLARLVRAAVLRLDGTHQALDRAALHARPDPRRSEPGGFVAHVGVRRTRFSTTWTRSLPITSASTSTTPTTSS